MNPCTQHRVVVFTALLFAALVASGCTAILDFTECTDDTECSAFGAGYSCVSNECVESTVECTSDAECTSAPRTSCMAGTCVEPTTTIADMTMVDMDATDVSDVDPDAPIACMSNLDCDPGATESICGASGTCEVVTTEECPFFSYPAGAENVIFIGSILPTGGLFDELGLPLQQAVELAISDFNDGGGLPGGRKIGWVGCNSLGSSERAQTAARHLMSDVGVPAIVGPAFSKAYLDTVTNITANGGVFTISPTATAENISGIDPLAYRNIPSDEYQADAIIARVADLASTKLIVLAKNDAYGNGLLSAVDEPLIGQVGTNNATFLNYPDPITLADQNAVLDEFTMVATNALAAGCPDAATCADTVLIFGTPEAVDMFKVFLGALQAAAIPSSSWPRFVFSHGAVPDLPRAVEETNPGLVDFIEGVTPNVFVEENILAFRTRFSARFSADPVNSAALAYDATFTVLFAMSSLPRDMPIGGAEIAAAIPDIQDPNGTAISFGDDNFVTTARTVLGNDGTVDLLGVSSSLDFDPTTHEVTLDYIGWEVSEDLGEYVPAAARIFVLALGMWVDAP